MSGQAFRGETEGAKSASSTNEQELNESHQGHLRRHWKAYTAVPLLLLLGVLLAVFLAIIPAAAQAIVSGNDLPIYSATLSNPTPDSIDFTLESSIHAPGSVSVTLKQLSLDLSGQNDSKPFTTLVLPETKLKGKTSIIVTNQTVEIEDMDNFGNFLQSAMYSRSFAMHVSGKTNTYVGAIKAPITINKYIVLPGLQNLTGFDIRDPKLLKSAESDGTNLLGTAIIPNHSKFALEIGNLTMRLAVENITVGNATINNLFLGPGTNELPLRAQVDLKKLMMNIRAISAAQPSFSRDGTLVVSAIGQTTIFNGQRLPYFEKVLNSLVLKTVVPVMELLKGGFSANASSVGNSSASNSSAVAKFAISQKSHGGPKPITLE